MTVQGIGPFGIIAAMRKCLLLSSVLALAALADEPSFTLLNKGMYWPLSRDVQFPYSSALVSNLDVKVSKSYVNNLNAYRLDSDEMTGRMAVVAKKRLEVPPPYGKKANRMLRLADVTDNLEPGFYRLEVDTGVRAREGGETWHWWRDVKDDCLFALTDLGLVAEVSPSKDNPRAVVLVHSLTDGRPVSGATVFVLTRANQVAGQGVTDGQGVANIPLTASFRPSEDSVYGVLATKDKDVSYLQLDWRSSVQSRDEDEQNALEDVRAFLFAERDICRPGESFDTGLFLRQSPQADMKVLANAPVELELVDPEDDRVELRRVRTDRWGFVAATWSVPSGARVGSWRVVAKLAGRTLGTFSVNVSAYVPDRFRVDFKAGLTNGVPEFRGVATYYFGEDVREASCKVEVSVTRAPNLPVWKGWTVGDGKLPQGAGWKAEGDVDDGHFEATYPDDELALIRKARTPLLLNAEGSATPPGARTVTARTSLRFDPTDRYVGVREAEALVRQGRAFEFAFLPAREGASVSTNGEIAVRLIRREWKCHAVERGSGYRMEWREERLEQPQLARRTGPGKVEYADGELPSGAYTLVATCGEELETRLDFWHWAGEVSERSVSPASLSLRCGCEKAKPGDEVSLEFDAAGEGMAYVAVGERGFEETKALAVRKGVNRFSVKVRPDAVSRYTYVVVTVVNRDEPNVRRLSGLARIRVDHAAMRYPIEMKVPEVAKPGETVKVSLSADGPGAVRLMAVDEGVLALTGYEAPDAFSEFHDYDFGCPFACHDLYSLVYPDLKILPNGQIGGGAVGAAIKRKNVRTRKDSTLKQKETARVVLPLVEIPASGQVTVPMTLPDFTGSMRLMAVAVDERRSGGAMQPVIVRDAASLFVNAPRAVTGGDRYELVAEVFNHDLPESDWTLDVDGRAFAGRLAKGASTNVSFVVAIPEDALGVRTVKGVLKIGGETFRDEVSVTVRARRPPVAEVVYLSLRPGETRPDLDEGKDAWVRLDENVMSECGSPRDVVGDALKWLGDYPYGCLEQVAAAAFPFLAAKDLRAIGLVDLAAASNAEKKVKAAYGEILQMAQDDGSFSMWPGGDDTWTDGSLFALHFVFAAERQGLVKPDPRGKMIRWLRELADGNNPKTRLRRAYAAYVLALAGEDGFAVPARNVLATRECDFASFLASAALVRGGFRADGETAFRQALVARPWETEELPSSVCWSRLRARAMALKIVTETLPGESGAQMVEPLVGKLMDGLRNDASGWGTTRDNAWAAAGLAAFCAAHPGKAAYVRRIRSGIPKFLPARSDAIKVTRRLPARVKRGELVEVEIELASAKDVESAVLCDLLPGGFELEDSALRTRSAKAGDNVGRSEIRDDRWLWFGELPRTGKDAKPLKLTYRLRAVTRGTFAVPALTVEDMYDPDCAGSVDAGGTVTVE